MLGASDQFSRQSKVGQHKVERFRAPDEDVGWLDVAVCEPERVCMVQGRCGLGHDFAHPGGGERVSIALSKVCQRSGLEELLDLKELPSPLSEPGRNDVLSVRRFNEACDVGVQ